MDLFVITAPGLAPLAADELRLLGIQKLEIEPAGVSFTGTLTQMYAANLWLRTASRVVARVATFRASAFHELERSSRKIPWETYVQAGRPVRFRVTCRKSRLYHSDAVAQRLAEAVERRIGSGAVDLASNVSDSDETDDETRDAGAGAQLFIVRFLHDTCTISADTSGPLLHLRGYRQALAKAPLRETLAAAMLLGVGWKPQVPLIDPMCGSGTIPIEAALLARRVPPGLERRFAFMEWPEFEADSWSRLIDAARAEMLPSCPVPIHGSDHIGGAIFAATQNAQRAGVTDDVDLRTAALSSLIPPPGEGWVVTNPPYGLRVGGDSTALQGLYAQLGRVLRLRCPGWQVAMLSVDTALEAAVNLGFREVLRTTNGGIPVRLVAGAVA